ncbi:MAG: peptidylprolyl isomerase [Muribaculaceae bacterium]|nr:peptidylprolyl isomerase [Muribaculaceae bacterium]
MAAACVFAAPIKKNVVDEVAWIVGDEPIFRSEIEEQYSQLRSEGSSIQGDPYCVIPERLAVEKLFLHQAKVDTIVPPEGNVQNQAEQRLQMFVNNLGSKEKVEEYFNKPFSSLKEQIVDMIRTQYTVEMVKNNLTKGVKGTPNDVRKYYDQLSADSIPYVPLQVEVQIIQINPVIPAQEIEDIKARLREMADRVNKGEASFSTLAIAYSEDGSARQGGELGFAGRSRFVPEFSNVAFNLNDPKKVSRIVETEYGYHIIQLIEKRGDQANFRHILLRPKVSEKDLEQARVRLDSLRKEILADKFTFEEAAQFVSQDKDTKNNKGLMVNPQTGSSRFEMSQLPPEIARRVESMEPGELSDAFVMKDAAMNKDVVVVVKLTSRTPGHKATLTDDFHLMKQMYEEYQKDRIVTDWIEKKIKSTYTKIGDGWDGCEFQYKGWKK